MFVKVALSKMYLLLTVMLCYTSFLIYMWITYSAPVLPQIIGRLTIASFTFVVISKKPHTARWFYLVMNLLISLLVDVDLFVHKKLEME